MSFSVVEIIRRKRDGSVLSKEEIDFFIQGYGNGAIADYQMAAFLMAVYFQGMNRTETQCLTAAMVASGTSVDLQAISGIVVDKHSTGGVSDTTTLILAPLVAAAGIPVAKMSGRGLGFTGGTIDKLESIPGFRTQLTAEEFSGNVRRWGLAITAQSADIVPADGKMYALRDVTATVESIPLIAASVMSKKIAGGAQRILLDVKVGQGAFMHDLDQAVQLAETMVRIGTDMGRRTVAILSSMEQPLGMAIGNRVEVLEAIAVLQGNGPAELWALCRELGAHMLVLGEKSATVTDGRVRMDELRASGAGLRIFAHFIKAQGGDERICEDPALLGLSPFRQVVTAVREGYITAIAADELGRIAGSLGAGRQRKEDAVDPGAGIRLHQRVGDFVRCGEVVAELFTSRQAVLDEAAQRTAACFRVADEPSPPPVLLLGRVDQTGVFLNDFARKA